MSDFTYLIGEILVIVVSVVLIAVFIFLKIDQTRKEKSARQKKLAEKKNGGKERCIEEMIEKDKARKRELEETEEREKKMTKEILEDRLIPKGSLFLNDTIISIWKNGKGYYPSITIEGRNKPGEIEICTDGNKPCTLPDEVKISLQSISGIEGCGRKSFTKFSFEERQKIGDWIKKNCPDKKRKTESKQKIEIDKKAQMVSPKTAEQIGNDIINEVIQVRKKEKKQEEKDREKLKEILKSQSRLAIIINKIWERRESIGGLKRSLFNENTFFSVHLVIQRGKKKVQILIGSSCENYSTIENVLVVADSLGRTPIVHNKLEQLTPEETKMIEDWFVEIY